MTNKYDDEKNCCDHGCDCGCDHDHDHDHDLTEMDMIYLTLEDDSELYN